MYSIKTIFKAVDGMTPTFTKMQASSNRFSAGLQNTVGKARLGFAKFRDGIFSIQSALGFLAMGMGLKMVTERIVGMSKAIDALVKTSRTIDITAQSLKELMFAGERLGVSNDVIVKGLQKLNRNVGELQRGYGTLFNVLQSQGSGATIAMLRNANSAEEAFNIMIDAIDKMPNQARKTALAVSGFGRSGVDLIKVVGAGRGEIDKYRKLFVELAGVMNKDVLDSSENFMDSMENMRASMWGFGVMLMTGLNPALEQLIKKFTDIAVESRQQTVAVLTELFKGLANAAIFVFENFNKIVSGTKLLVKALISLEIVKYTSFLFMGLATGVGLATGAITLSTIATGGLTAVLAVLGSIASIGLVPALGLIGIVLGGVIAIGAVFSEKFRGFLFGIVKGIWEVVGTFVKFLVPMFKVFGGMLGNFGMSIKGIEEMRNVFDKINKEKVKASEKTLANTKDEIKLRQEEKFKADAFMSARDNSLTSRAVRNIEMQRRLNVDTSGTQTIRLGMDINKQDNLSDFKFKIRSLATNKSVELVTTGADQ